MTENWLQKFKDLAEGKKAEQPKPAEAHKEALEAGQAHNDQLHKQQLLHRRAAFDSNVPRNHKVSGVLGRPEIIEQDVHGKVITHVRGIDAPVPEHGKESTRPSDNGAEKHVAAQSPTERELRAEHATHSMLETASKRFGQANIESLHIAKDDVSGALSALLLGPDRYKQMGAEQAQDFGKRLLVFGVAPLFGMAEETRKQFREHTVETLHEGSGNILTGTIAGALLEHVNPLVVTAATLGGVGMLIKDEVQSPEHKARNNAISSVAQKLDGASTTDLFDLCDSTRKLIGPELYKGAFVLATGGIGMPEGSAIGTTVKEEAHGLTKLRPEELLKSLKDLGEETWGILGSVFGEQRQLAGAGGPAHIPGMKLPEIPDLKAAENGILRMEGAFSGKDSPVRNVRKLLDEIANKPTSDKFEAVVELNKELLKTAKMPIYSHEQAEAMSLLESKLQNEIKQTLKEVAGLKPAADLVESKPQDKWSSAEEALLEKYQRGEDAIYSIITDRLKTKYGWDGHTPGALDSSIALQSGVGSQRLVSNEISKILNQGLDKNPEIIRILEANGISKERAKDWIGLPMPGSNAADHAGCDYLLVNKSTGEMYPIDVTEKCSFVRNGRVVDSKLMNSSLITDKPGDRQHLVIAVAAEHDIENATRNAWMKMSNKPMDANFESVLRNHQMTEILAHMISQPSKLNILDAQLPSSDVTVPIARQAYELWKFSADVSRLGFAEWAKSLEKGINYLRQKDRNIPDYFKR